MKKLFLAILIGVLMMQATAAVAAPSDLPPYDSHRLNESELAAFFAAGGEDLNEVFKLLERKHETVFGMNFTAVEETASEKYRNWIAEFVLTSNKDVYAAVLGKYGSFNVTMPAVVELKAGEEFRVVKESIGWELTYEAVINLVKSFDCSAVPVTEELKAAWVNAGGDASELDAFYSAEPNTRLKLSLTLTDPETGEEYDLSWDEFVYKPETFIRPAAVPSTGDEANLILWAMLAAAAIGGMIFMGKKNYAR